MGSIENPGQLVNPWPQVGYFVPLQVCQGLYCFPREAELVRSVSVGTLTPGSRRSSLASNHVYPPSTELLAEPVNEAGGERVAWEHHHVSLTRVPGYGFGIAVSGGRDNPHFTNGDPAIAISDVLKAGPAEGKLLVNDRIISANGISLENVEYATAVQVLRDSGNTVLLAVRRRVILPSYSEPHTIKLSLTKTSKKDDFGLVLGSKIFVREVANKCVSDKDGNTIQDGDVLLKINNHTTDGMTLKEARKLIESSKDKLNLVVRRENKPPNNHNSLELTTLPKESHSNYLDSLNSPNYSSQNLYVQPPSRHAQQHSSLAEDKSNLVPRGRSRGPLLDVSLSQLDRPATPVHHHAHSRSRSGLDEPGDPLGPPRPPPPRPEDFYSSRRQLYEDDPLLQRSKQAMPDPRFITFQKEGSVGIRLTGGNEVGIFVTAVQPGSPASLQGLQPGDKILKVNDMDMKGVTREEAVLFLLSLQDQIDLIVQLRRDEYDQIVASQRGDSFHIKAHFNYDQPNKGEMSFRKGDVFHVVDTLHNGVVGSWQVFRIGRNNQEVQKGIIPNKSRAEELATAQFNATKKELTASESRGSFFRRRRGSHRRSKSLGKEHWDDVVFSDSVSKFPAYERVILRHPGFVRPVVLFGPVADLARDKMLKDFPDKFTSPQCDNLMEETSSKSQKTSGIIRLSAIREIMERNKHALLDITPNAVDRLNYAQFYPIVIFLRADNKHVIKELRAGLSKSAHKSSKKLFEQCQKLDKIWGHTFSCAVTLTATDSAVWYRKVRELVDKNQAAPLWMSETKPAACLSDDFLFPMTSRLSYASSPESDLELPPPGATRLVKSSSDPSVATQDDTTPTYSSPPPYTPPYNQNMSEPPGPSKRRTQGTDSKYGFSPSGGEESSHHSNYAHHHHHHGMTNGNGHGLGRSPLAHSPPLHGQNPPELPPRIDRSNKPPGRSAAERLFGKNEDLDNSDPPNYINATPHLRAHTSSAHISSLDRHNLKTQSSYDSVSSYDSYNNRLGPNAHDDLKSNGNARNHDPYRFTRSTAQPVGRSQAKPPPPEYMKYSGHSRPNDYKPLPPPKSNSYKPVPPPKPKNYRPPAPESYDKYHHAKSYSSAGNGEDSGHGSSLDRTRGGQYYYNVPPQRNSTGLDLANRDQRGSAFELYKKPTLEARHMYLDNQLRVGEGGGEVVRGVFNDEGGVLTSVESGVAIVIPPGALPSGTQQEIYFTVCNNVEPPDDDKGEGLLSPLVLCGPHGLKFRSPVELRLPQTDSENNCVSVLVDHF